MHYFICSYEFIINVGIQRSNSWQVSTYVDTLYMYVHTLINKEIDTLNNHLVRIFGMLCKLLIISTSFDLL